MPSKALSTKICSVPDCDYPKYGKGLCLYHWKQSKAKQWQRNSNKIERLAKKGKRRKKVRTQKDVFKEIYEKKRDNWVSYMSGEPLPGNTEMSFEWNAQNTYQWFWIFAHILGKGAYPSWKLRKNNIVTLLPMEHFAYDNSSDEKILAMKGGGKILRKKENLKRQFYKK